MDIETLKDSFQKLLTYTYFDKNDFILRKNVAEFSKSLKNKDAEDDIFRDLLEIANGNNKEKFKLLLSQIELCFYPKKIRPDVDKKDEHFITNIPQGNALIERLLVRAKIPTELMILDVAWLLTYGPDIDNNLKSSCYANRLDLTPRGEKIILGSSIFKKYIYQYRHWWDNGIKKANELIKDNNKVLILNFDIRDCYHSIDFNFENFINSYKKEKPYSDIAINPLTKIIKQIYERYWEIVKESNAQPFTGRNKDKNALPMSLLSAHLLANWYLSPLDDYIENKKPNDSYYGRYVDDCMIVVPTHSEIQDALSFINEIFPHFIEGNEEKVFGFAQDNNIGELERISNFSLQTNKLYFYYFDCNIPQESLDKIKDQQIERSSEFRFLTDEADEENGRGLEFSTLVQSFHTKDDDDARRFDILEVNKYKLSVYFAKLNQRLAKFGKEYEHFTEVDKVFKYFHGHLLIKHYMLWEKIFTTFVLAGKKEYVNEFYNSIKNEIESLKIDDNLFNDSESEGLLNIKSTLTSHLEESFLMATSLHLEDYKEGNTLYIDTFMVRNSFYQLPLQEFCNKYEKNNIQNNIEEIQNRIQNLNIHWLPYYVKYYNIVCTLMYGKEFDPKIYKEAFEIYKRLNRITCDTEKLEEFMKEGLNDDECEFNTRKEEKYAPEKLTISAVEMLIDSKSLNKIIEDCDILDYNKVNLMQTILDKISAVKNTNIFIMPELSLPSYELPEFCQYSSKNDIAFIAGLEYIVCNKKYVYNYIVTCLPIKLFGQKDAIPIIRLKNYYAPAEFNLIEEEKKMVIPISRKKWKILYHWEGHVFTDLYCFELTSIKDRAYFISKIDAMYCPVFNKDTKYFNNISESCSRDLHCYLIMSNVSQYGDTRVTQPTTSETMNIMKVKGGNTDDNKAIVLSANLNIKGLREFQKLSPEIQRHIRDKENPKEEKDLSPEEKKKEDLKRRFKHFKVIPPDYDVENIDKRENRFLLKSID